MVSGNGKRKIENSEVIAGDRQQFGNPLEHWKRQTFDNAPANNNLDKILEIPKKEDMAGVISRARLSKRERIAAVNLAKHHIEFGDDENQEVLRIYCGSSLAEGGLGKVIQTFIGTNLLAPDMFRAALNMPKNKNHDGEEVHRGSDFRASAGDQQQMGNR